MRKSTAPIIYKPDDAGVVTTWMAQSAIEEETGIDCATISRWSCAGVVRFLAKSAGRGKHVAVFDVIRLRMMTPAQCREAGIVKTSAERRAKGERWRIKTQAVTREVANHHYEEWDEYDSLELIHLVELGIPLQLVANKLGRTYEAVTTKVDHLRRAGELPPAEHPEYELSGLIERLTDDERAALSA